MIKICSYDYDKIVRYCRKKLPNEACGLLAGEISDGTKTVKKVYFLTNIDASPFHFSMSPKEQFKVAKDIRKSNMSLIGNFHSHPGSLPIPSEEDKRLAYDVAAEYLILSLMDKVNPVIKAFGIDKEKNVREHGIEILL